MTREIHLLCILPAAALPVSSLSRWWRHWNSRRTTARRPCRAPADASVQQLLRVYTQEELINCFGSEKKKSALEFTAANSDERSIHGELELPYHLRKMYLNWQSLPGIYKTKGYKRISAFSRSLDGNLHHNRILMQSHFSWWCGRTDSTRPSSVSVVTFWYQIFFFLSCCQIVH